MGNQQAARVGGPDLRAGIDAAFVLRARTPGMEGAAGGHPVQTRHRTGDLAQTGCPALAAGVEAINPSV